MQSGGPYREEVEMPSCVKPLSSGPLPPFCVDPLPPGSSLPSPTPTPPPAGPLARINPTAPQALTQAPPGPLSPPRPPLPRRAGVSSGRPAAGCPRRKGCPGGGAPSRRPRQGPCAAPRARRGFLRSGSARRALGRAGNAGGETWGRRPEGRWAGNHLPAGARKPGVEGGACWGRVNRRSPLFAYSWDRARRAAQASRSNELFMKRLAPPRKASLIIHKPEGEFEPEKAVKSPSLGGVDPLRWGLSRCEAYGEKGRLSVVSSLRLFFSPFRFFFLEALSVIWKYFCEARSILRSSGKAGAEGKDKGEPLGSIPHPPPQRLMMKNFTFTRGGGSGVGGGENCTGNTHIPTIKVAFKLRWWWKRRNQSWWGRSSGQLAAKLLFRPTPACCNQSDRELCGEGCLSSRSGFLQPLRCSVRINGWRRPRGVSPHGMTSAPLSPYPGFAV